MDFAWLSLIIDSVSLTILSPVLCPAIVSPPPYTCLSTPSLFRRCPASSVLWVDPTTYVPSPHLVSSASGTPHSCGGEHRSSQVPAQSFEQHAVDYDPGGVSTISPITMASLLPSMFLITWACSTIIAFSGLNTFTLADYGLLSPCLRFTHAITRINAKLGSDGRLTLSGWLFNQLDCTDFAWRTKNPLLLEKV